MLQSAHLHTLILAYFFYVIMPPNNVKIALHSGGSIKNVGLETIIALQLPAILDTSKFTFLCLKLHDLLILMIQRLWLLLTLGLKNVINKYNLSGNKMSYNKLHALLEYPDPSKKTSEHYFQFSVLLSLGYLIEQYTSEVLQ
jgi:hypothetical protein